MYFFRIFKSPTCSMLKTLVFNVCGVRNVPKSICVLGPAKKLSSWAGQHVLLSRAIILKNAHTILSVLPEVNTSLQYRRKHRSPKELYENAKKRADFVESQNHKQNQKQNYSSFIVKRDEDRARKTNECLQGLRKYVTLNKMSGVEAYVLKEILDKANDTPAQRKANDKPAQRGMSKQAQSTSANEQEREEEMEIKSGDDEIPDTEFEDDRTVNMKISRMKYWADKEEVHQLKEGLMSVNENTKRLLDVTADRDDYYTNVIIQSARRNQMGFRHSHPQIPVEHVAPNETEVMKKFLIYQRRIKYGFPEKRRQVNNVRNLLLGTYKGNLTSLNED